MDSQTAFDLQSSPSISQFFSRLFSADFMPHGHCFFWRSEILWLHVFSDALIALAYYAIPVALFYFARKRRDLPFHRMFYLFAAFIFLCGTTHLFAIITQWQPYYRAEGIVKLLTGFVSIVTAVYLWPVIPKAIAFPNIQRINEELEAKANALELRNQELQKFSEAVTGREERIIQLKKKINALSEELGRMPPYDLYFEKRKDD